VKDRIVPKLSKRQPGHPLLRFIECHACQIIFQTLVDALRLPVSLRVIRRTVSQLNFEGFEYVFPHRAGEDSVSIRDKQQRRSMKLENVI
jgi:hypothetical protein